MYAKHLFFLSSPNGTFSVISCNNNKTLNNTKLYTYSRNKSVLFIVIQDE